MADKEKSMLTKFWGSPSSAEPLHTVTGLILHSGQCKTARAWTPMETQNVLCAATLPSMGASAACTAADCVRLDTH